MSLTDTRILYFEKLENGNVLLRKAQDDSLIASFNPAQNLVRFDADPHKFKIQSEASFGTNPFVLDYRAFNLDWCTPIIQASNFNDFLYYLARDYFYLENDCESEAPQKGEKGDTGEQGEKGNIGLAGEKGDTGEQGKQGEKGEFGLPGKKGDIGEQGKQGDKGETGTLPTSQTFLLTQDTILSDTYHNGVILIGANIKITIPAGLRIYFECNFITKPKKTLKIVLAGVSVLNNVGLNMDAGKMCTLKQIDQTNEFILMGEI
jgi:hypothetical protein